MASPYFQFSLSLPSLFLSLPLCPLTPPFLCVLEDVISQFSAPAAYGHTSPTIMDSAPETIIQKIFVCGYDVLITAARNS